MSPPATVTEIPRADARAAGTLFKAGIGLGVIGLGATAALGLGSEEARTQLFFSWLTAFAFFTTIALGALFFTILHHLVRASWSTPLRRVAENLAGNLPLMAVFFVPVLLGMHELYHWTHADVVAADPILQGKQAYLNTGFWIGRAVVYFAIWLALAWFYRRSSLRQDETGDVGLTFRMRAVAPVGTLLFALSITFAGFDWLMSLDPHWFSTIFGVYVFAGSVVALFATLALTGLWLTGPGGAKEMLNVENLHDVGKLLFGFTVFWTYIAFSQYFLIWYGNIPEETVWYQVRFEHGWQTYMILLAVGHFVLPFWVLMSRHTKRNRAVLGLTAAWMLVMHYLDMYLLVSPTHHHAPHPSLLDLTTLLGIGGFFLALFARRLSAVPAVPAKDPQLTAAWRYDNA